MSETRATRFTIAGAITAGLAVVGFCLILLWHDPLLFWNDDYALSVLPVFADVARSWSEGHLPLLSPYSWVCGNLAGEFQYGTFSIFVNAAVILIWKFPLTFPQQAAALSITHLFVLAVGAFVLARDRRLSIPLSIFVALVAALNGWIICWGATDWFGALGAFAWLPWAWWGAERALDRERSRWRFLWPAPFVYLVVTGGFPYTVLMFALLVAWLSIKSLGQTRKMLSILPLCFGTLLGFALSSPAWLAIFDYVHGSARELQPSSTHWQWIVPPAALPGFILPCWTVNWANFSTQYLPHGGSLCLSLYLDFSRVRCGLDVRRVFLPKSRTGSRLDAGRRHVCCIARDILLHSAELRRAEIQSQSKTDGSGAARSATPLFEHLSTGGTDLSRGKKTGTGRTNRAARQHVDVGRTALHQRLQPDSPGWRRAHIRVRGPRRDRPGYGKISAGRASATAR